METANCNIIAQPHPFQTQRVQCETAAGQTLAQMLGNAAHSCAVRIGGHDVPRALWDRVRPKAGQQIEVRMFPQGGDDNKWIRAILMIVLVVVTYGYGATWAAGFGITSTTGIAAFQAGLMMVGSLAISPLIGSALEVQP